MAFRTLLNLRFFGGNQRVLLGDLLVFGCESPGLALALAQIRVLGVELLLDALLVLLSQSVLRALELLLEQLVLVVDNARLCLKAVAVLDDFVEA